MAVVPKVNPHPWWKRKHKRRRRNPNVRQAEDFYKDFHWGDEPTEVVSRRVSPPPDVATELGELVAVTYLTTKDGEKAEWEHEFGEEGGDRPTLVADPDTKRLHIVGGDYTITSRGIED